jgi:hypothetical protein
MPFDSPDVPLSDLLSRAGNGKLQLPDFQREWKWDTDRIASLLASIAQGHPVGVMMMLEVGGVDVNFAPYPLAGVESNGLEDPEWLILDGQQRITSLYQALASGKPVDTTGNMLFQPGVVSGVSMMGSPGCGDHLMANDDGSTMRLAATSSLTSRSQYVPVAG